MHAGSQEGSQTGRYLEEDKVFVDVRQVFSRQPDLSLVQLDVIVGLDLLLLAVNELLGEQIIDGAAQLGVLNAQLIKRLPLEVL